MTKMAKITTDHCEAAEDKRQKVHRKSNQVLARCVRLVGRLRLDLDGAASATCTELKCAPERRMKEGRQEHRQDAAGHEAVARQIAAKLLIELLKGILDAVLKGVGEALYGQRL